MDLRRKINDGLQLIIGGKAEIEAGLEEISAKKQNWWIKDAAGL